MKRSASARRRPRRAIFRFRRLLEAARKTGAEAIHPGYGFLSENAGFAEACAQTGIVFIGPTPEQMRAFGLKHTARAIAAENGVPAAAGHGSARRRCTRALASCRRIGYPVMLKSTAGGGGIGMRLCSSRDELREAFEAVERLSQASFGSSRPLPGEIRRRRPPHRSADLRRWHGSRDASASAIARRSGAIRK